MKNAINWFAIPALDLSRAVKFYSTIMGLELHITQMGGSEMAFFPVEEGGIGGHIFTDDAFNPSSDGAVLYLNGGNDLQQVLGKIQNAGGKVVIPKTEITKEIGFFGMFIDSEGNRIALHSPN